jgi:hypothetical protein
MFSAKFKIFLTLTLFTLFFSTLNAGWMEQDKFGVGNSYGSTFHIVPNSKYIVVGGMNSWVGSSKFDKLGNKFLIYDISTGRCRGTKISDSELWNPAIIQNPVSGWDIYFNSNNKFGMINITPDGLFGEISWLPLTYEGNIQSVGVSSRGEAWFASNKIYCFKPEGWTILDYPAGWDPDFGSLKLFVTDDQKFIFFLSNGNTIGNLQGVFYNLEKGVFSSVLLPDNTQFAAIIDVQEWKGHENQYLILNQESLWVYNSVTESLDSIIEGFQTSSNKIIQSADGNKLFLIQYKNFFNPKKDLLVLNMVDKSIETHTFEFDKNWGFSLSSSSNLPFVDTENNRIIAIICDQFTLSTTHESFKPVLIDLNDFTLQYIPGVFFLNLSSFTYNRKLQRIMALGTYVANIVFTDLSTGGQQQSITLSYKADSWSVKDKSDSPDLIGNSWGYEFTRLLPVKRQEIIDTQSRVLGVCQYFDGERVFVNEEAGYKEYLLADGSSEDITLPHKIDITYSHPSRDLIIGIGDNTVHFIKPHGVIRTYVPDEENVSMKKYLFDPDNEAVWLIYQNKDTKEWIFDNISSLTYEKTDSFTLPESTFSNILDLTYDPLQRYLYLINEVVYSRELVILDLQIKDVVKRITLQENAVPPKSYKIVFPCLVPVPSEDKLFLWDHYNSWCINTENLELVYGSSVDSPGSFYLNGIPIQGTWDEERQLAVVVDKGYNPMNPMDRPRVLRINIDTGEVKDNITFKDYETTDLFFPKDKNKVNLLNRNEATLYTVYIDTPWESPGEIYPSTNYIQLGSGDKAKFTVNVKNPLDVEQKATAFIWLYVPGVDAPFFFDGTSLTATPEGIPLTLPANLDVTADILTFTMPAGVPEGFYNFNAIFINERNNPGPMGTWNFYVKD